MNAHSVDDVLDRLAPRLEFAHDWTDVLSRAGVEAVRSSRSGWRRRKWVLAAAVVAAILVPVAAATVAAKSDWWFFDSHGDQPITRPVVVTTGTWDGKRWQLVAYRATPKHGILPADLIEICTAVMPYAAPPSASSGGALGCGGFSVKPAGSPGGRRGINYASSQSADLPHWAAGPVVDTAAEVALYFRNGDVLRVPTLAPPESLGPVRFYATALPKSTDPAAERPVKVVGIDEGGAVVACAPLDASARC